MPRGDRTGPWGLGPLTGRAAGYCTGYPVPGFMNPVPGFGRGFGWGRGWGRGFGRGFGRRWWGYMPQYPYAHPPYAYPPPATYSEYPYNYPQYGYYPYAAYPQYPAAPYARCGYPYPYTAYPGYW